MSRLQQLRQSALARRLASGAFWTLLGNVFARTASVVSMVLLARLLGTEQLGALGVVQNTVLTLQTLAGLGLGWAATRYVARYKKTDPARVGRIIYFVEVSALVAGTLCATAMWTGASWLASSVLAAPALKTALQIGSAALIVGASGAVRSGLLMGFEEFRKLAFFNVASGTFGLVVTLVAGWRFGLTGAVAGMVASQLADWLLLRVLLARVVRQHGIVVSGSAAWAERRMFWDFGLPAVFGGVVFQASIWLSTVILVNRPGGYAEMGFYNAANQWFSALMFLPLILAQSSVPVLAEYIALRRFDEVRKIFKGSLGLTVAIVTLAAVAGSALSPLLMGLYGPGFQSKWPTLVLLLLAAALASVQAPAAQIISTSGYMWIALAMQLAFAAVFGVTSVGLAGWGSEGIAMARLLAYLAYAAISFKAALYLLKKLGAVPSPTEPEAMLHRPVVS